MKSQHVCVSRPRRFGKSMAAEMLQLILGMAMILEKCLRD